MGRPGSTHAKRQREQARAEKAKEKQLIRAERRDRPPRERDGDEDPDLVGLVAGPQPPRTD